MTDVIIMEAGIILVGNPADPKVVQIADAYRDLGIVVHIEDCRQTRAIGGREFHTIVVDELLDERLRQRQNYQLNHYTEAYRKHIATVGHTIVENTLKEIYTPKNQPHGPLRKGRGGKLRRW